MIFLFPLFLCWFACSTFASAEPKGCPTPSCNDTIPENSVVEEFCTKHDGLMTGRCCNFNNTVIGLDLRFCGINKLNITEPEFMQVECLDLRDNLYDKFTSDELIGLLQLDFLYLPTSIPCPGGKNAWNETTYVNNMTFCYHQLNPCETLNITCGEAENANCVHTGPGLAKCLCIPGHFGYKCLNEGVFPVAVFSTSVILPTIVLSIVLWFLHGRDPYRKQQL